METKRPSPLPFSSQFQLGSDLQICRILNGMWQVSGAHGSIDSERAIESMFAYLDSGFTTWDLADHYGPAEDFIGEFRRRLAERQGPGALANIEALTKWVPSPGRMDRAWVDENVNRALNRMDVETLDLLQFHWWDYGDERYLEAMAHLSKLQDEGRIRHLGLTNFDTLHLQKVVAEGYQVVSNQIQFSLIDRRPEVQMTQYCQDQGIHLLAYGTVAGGLLSKRYLGKPEPGRSALTTASLSKYKQMVDAWGGWDLFQELLVALNRIADRHRVSIADVAIRYVIDRPAVAGVIVGVRLGVSEHREDNANVFGFKLGSEDLEEIELVSSRSRDLYQAIGDCGSEYRG
jgi:aryl-alcohol dehydrogenase-like predicted oxidoreductase